MKLFSYLRGLSKGRIILWCYFIWWIVVVVRYFDPTIHIWITALGLSGVIGFALLINTTASGTRKVKLEPWPVFRLFLTPFCVSSFAALVKGKSFVLIFSPHWAENAIGAGLILLFLLSVWMVKRTGRSGILGRGIESRQVIH